ncbi:MAG: biotin synthase BioB [Intestinimonas sp.]|jgi:biotin synthase|nr:biotin synthase BioB [Intestinimonas sp.]
MSVVDCAEQRVLRQESVTKEDALILAEQPTGELCAAADRIRRHFCGDKFDLCTIISAKSGHCPEDCKFCAQSACYHTAAECYPMLPRETIAARAESDAKRGVLRLSLVTSGRRLSDREVDEACRAIRAIRAGSPIHICVSMGLLTQEQYGRLKEAGADRVHNNLETSARYFPTICTTHTIADKVAAIRAAQAVGMKICSGGILGLGETMEDRIDMAILLRELGIRSVPVNVLNPISGTPFEKNPRLSIDEIRTTIAVFRFLLPDAAIRMAGGRGLMPDHGRLCFESGANAAISGDMLTTAGYTVETDLALLAELGYRPALIDKACR